MGCAELVGRAQELGILTGCLDAAMEGSPRVVLCLGEPGIGKTRLCEELNRRAAARGVPTVWGRGVDTVGAPPYWPWRQVLRALATRVDLSAIADDQGLTADLATLAPELFAAFTGRVGVGPSPESRFRLFDAVGRLLGVVTSREPLVIVLDDAHWADYPSLLLLHHVTRGLSSERLLMVVNHRDTEPFAPVLGAELLREPVTRQLSLPGLTSDEVGRQLNAVAGRVVGTSDVVRVHAMTGGNPLFVGELGRVLADQRDGVSPVWVTTGVRQAIEVRLTRLSEPTVAFLRAASVVGQEFSVPVVARVLGLPALTCLAATDEAVAAGLVAASSTGGYRFAHALMRDAIEAGLASSERVLLHRRAAESIEEFYAGQLEGHLFDLARHWSVAAVAGDRARAASWIERAGREAMRQLAFEEGARLFRLAVSAGADELDDVDRCRLLLAAGEALHLSADVPGRLQVCLDAAAVARRIHRPDLLAEAALLLEGVLEYRSDRAAQQLCLEAMNALGAAPSALAARVAARYADTSNYLGDAEASSAAADRALRMAEQSGDQVALKAALTVRQMVCSGPAGSVERAQLATRMLALGRDTGDDLCQLNGHLWQIDVAFEQGSLAEVARILEQVARDAEVVGGPLARWQFLRAQAALAQAQARFPDAHRLIGQAHQVIEATGHPFDYATRVSLLAMTGHHVGHGESGSGSLLVGGLSGVSPGPRGTHTRGIIDTIGLSSMLVDAGRITEAADRYRTLGPIDTWRVGPVIALVSYAFAVQVAAALGATRDLAALYDLLAPYRGLHVSGRGGALYYSGPVDLYLGLAAAHLGRLDEAAADLEQAVDACADNGAAGFHAEALCELITVLTRRATPADLGRARALANECRKQLAALNMAPWLARLDQLADLLQDDPPELLTRREREIAELVAQGLTNRDIAAQLYLSERTAQNHVQHILTKLGVTNRSRIAVWVTNEQMTRPR